MTRWRPRFLAKAEPLSSRNGTSRISRGSRGNNRENDQGHEQGFRGDHDWCILDHPLQKADPESGIVFILPIEPRANDRSMESCPGGKVGPTI